MKPKKYIFKLSAITFFSILFFIFTPFASAFFAYFSFDNSSVDISLASLESTTTPLSISIYSFISPYFDWSSGGAGYKIERDNFCNAYDQNSNCIDRDFDLCPYLSIEPKNEEATEVGFSQDASDMSYVARGEINDASDLLDNWTVTIKSPCFDGECPDNYDPIKYGNPLSPSQKGATFSCVLSVVTSEPPVLVQSLLKTNRAYAIVNIAPQNHTYITAVLTGDFTPQPVVGNSNVMFIPGVMGSHLYEQTGSVDCGVGLTGQQCFSDDELWLSVFDSKHADLALDGQGKSIKNVYTKDDTQNNGENETGVMDEIFGSNIYNSFIDDLRNWKNDGTINDYAFIPYDWRLSLDDIITNGVTSTRSKLSYTTPQNFSQSFILKKLSELQKSSPTGRVTIIAHSNGGLVAKALIQKLKDTKNPLYDKIDKLILVAVPQVGTPDAITTLLHGSEIGFKGAIMNQDRSRQLAENMPAVYNLLPSGGYFNTVDPAYAVDKVVSFEDKPLFSQQISKYGLFVSNQKELIDYILGTDGRSKPTFSDTVNPNIGNLGLYSKSVNVHGVLDSWTPPPRTKVIQVAGWGEETLVGIDYKTYVDDKGSPYLSYKPRVAVDGDGTVVVPSALWMSTSTPNVERWWVDLQQDGGVIINRVHRDILEISKLEDFIKSKITDSPFSDQNNIVVNSTNTLTSNDTRLHYTLHSPLTLGITDSSGRYTGLDPITKQVVEEIPNVIYKQIGDVQFVSVPSTLAHTLKLRGYQKGSFSLDIDKQVGNTVASSVSFQGVPSSTTTVVTMNVPAGFDISSSTLKIDINGDGVVDSNLKANPNGVVVYDQTPPEFSASFSTSTKSVVLSAIDMSPTKVVRMNASDTATSATDSQSNISILRYTKYKDSSTKSRFVFNSIIRNGITSNLIPTTVQYIWTESAGLVSDLTTTVFINNVEKYVFSFSKTTNTTVIKDNTVNTVTTRQGFVSPTIKTQLNEVKINY